MSGGGGEAETPKERTLEEMNFEELRNEMRRRKLKVGKKQREEVINLLRKEDKGQMMIVWGKQHMGDTVAICEHRGKKGRMEEERGGEEASPSNSRGRPLSPKVPGG